MQMAAEFLMPEQKERTIIKVEGVDFPFQVEKLAENIYRVDLNRFFEEEFGPEWDKEFLSVAKEGRKHKFHGGEAPTSLVRSNFITNYRITSGEKIAGRLPQLVDKARGPLLHLAEEVIDHKLRPAGDSKHWLNMNYHLKFNETEDISYETHIDRNFATALIGVTSLAPEQGGVTQFWNPSTINTPPLDEVSKEVLSHWRISPETKQQISRWNEFWNGLEILDRIKLLRDSGVFEYRMRDRRKMLAEATVQKGFAVIFRGDIIPHGVTSLRMTGNKPTERLTIPVDFDSLLVQTEGQNLWGDPKFDKVLLGENGE
jgi:hypothetical protein